MAVGRAPRDGDFYIQRSNQDFWLRENGVWVRKGNIRDEGSSGLVNVSPVMNLGLSFRATLTRTRFLEAAMGLGLEVGALVTRERLLQVALQLGLTNITNVDVTHLLQVAFELGLAEDVVMTVGTGPKLMLEVTPALGLALTAELTHEHPTNALSVSFALGLNQASPLQKVKLLSAAFALGLSQTTGLSHAVQGIVMGTPVTNSFSDLSNKGSIDCTFTTTEPDTLVCFFIMTWTFSTTPRPVTGFNFGAFGTDTPTLRYQKGHRDLTFSEASTLTYYWYRVQTPGTYFVAFNIAGSGRLSSVLYAVPFSGVDWTNGPFDPGTSPANPAVNEHNSSPGVAMSQTCTSSGLSPLMSLGAFSSRVSGAAASNGYTNVVTNPSVTGINSNLIMTKPGNDAAQVTGSHTAAFLLHDLIAGA